MLRELGDFIGPPPEGACLRSDLVDADDDTPGLQADCVVSEVREPDTTAQTERLLRVCDNASDPASSQALPCYTLRERADDCRADAPYWIDLFYAEDDVVPPGTELVVRCLAK